MDQLQLIMDSKIGSFCVNICMGLRLEICDMRTSLGRRDKVDFMFVPSLTRDLKTLEGDLESRCYDYYTHIVVANTSEYGGSGVWGPFHSNRQILLLNKGQEEVSIVEIDLKEFSEAWNGKESAKYKRPDRYV